MNSFLIFRNMSFPIFLSLPVGIAASLLPSCLPLVFLAGAASLVICIIYFSFWDCRLGFGPLIHSKHFHPDFLCLFVVLQFDSSISSSTSSSFIQRLAAILLPRPEAGKLPRIGTSVSPSITICQSANSSRASAQTRISLDFGRAIKSKNSNIIPKLSLRTTSNDDHTNLESKQIGSSLNPLPDQTGILPRRRQLGVCRRIQFEF